jgi:hypothetical protein
MAYTAYRHPNLRALSDIPFETRLSNQVILSGTDPTLSVPDGIFFLESLIVSSGVTITDGKSNSVVAGVTSFDHSLSPLRCDYGITITGTVVYAKGFVLDGMFAA